MDMSVVAAGPEGGIGKCGRAGGFTIRGITVRPKMGACIFNKTRRTCTVLNSVVHRSLSNRPDWAVEVKLLE